MPESPETAFGKRPGWKAISKELAFRFQQDECSTRAAALAFTGIFSLIPLMLLGLALLGILIPDPQQANERLVSFLSQLIPGVQGERVIRSVLDQIHLEATAQGLIKGSLWAAIFGILVQIWAGSSLFVSAATPLNKAWDVSETRSFLRLRLVGLGVFIGVCLFFVLSLLPAAIPDFLRPLGLWPSLTRSVPFWLEGPLWLLAVVLDIGMFTLIYRILPNTRVPWRVALAGGTIVGLFWELFKLGFSIYLAHFGNYNKLYGAFGSIALLVTWIWYSCIVLLAGGILCKMFDEHWYTHNSFSAGVSRFHSDER